MRFMVWGVLVLAGLWGGWWVIGSQGAKRGAEAMLADLQAGGVEVQTAGVSVAGFPSRFDLTIDQPRLFDPASALGWQGPFLQVMALSYKPWHLIAAFPNTQVLTLPAEDITLASEKMQGSLVLVPGADLTLDRATAVAGGVVATSSLGWVAAMDELRLAARSDPSRSHAYDIGAEVTGLRPDAALLVALNAAGADLPAVVERAHLDALAEFSAPIDRHVAASRPELRGLMLRELSFDWGGINGFASGNLVPDAAGQAEGTIEIRLTGWRALLPVLVATGAVQPDFLPTVESMLAALAAQGGDPERLVLPLVMQGGLAKLGPLPIGPAPYLVQRQ